MARLVVVSNRVADPRKPGAGGLAVALGEALRESGGLWFGWSGRTSEVASGGALHTQRAGEISLTTIDLSQADHDAYYLGYSNGVLWPVFHYRLDLADFDAADIEGYRRVNRLMAHKLMGLLRPDDVIWVQDYHLIPMAAELRAMGCGQRIGFFLHIPLPPRTILAAIPQHGWLMRSLLAYDLVGFQSKADLEHFAQYVVDEAEGQRQGEDRFHAYGRSVRARGADRYRRRRVRRPRALGGRARDAEDDARDLRPPPAAGRGRPARLFQGAAAAHPRLPQAARGVPGEPAQCDADPGRRALA